LFLNSFSFYQAIRLLSRKTVNKYLYLYLYLYLLCRRLQLTCGLDGPVLDWFRSYTRMVVTREQCARRGTQKSPSLQLFWIISAYFVYSWFSSAQWALWKHQSTFVSSVIPGHYLTSDWSL